MATSQSSHIISPSKIEAATPEPAKSTLLSKIFFLSLLNTLGVPALVFLYIKETALVSNILRLARQAPIDRHHSESLLQKALSLPSAQVYVQSKALEYQITEGYCAVATERCICKSIPHFPEERIPDQMTRGGPRTANKFAEALSCNRLVKSTVVHGSEGYDAFRNVLIKSNQPQNYRVAVNFLRSSLFGFPTPRWLVFSSWLLALMGGHFSPILGYLDEENLVAIFDVNAKYGFYLVEARRLFASVNTFDFMNGTTRGLVLTEIIAKES